MGWRSVSKGVWCVAKIFQQQSPFILNFREDISRNSELRYSVLWKPAATHGDVGWERKMTGADDGVSDCVVGDAVVRRD